MLIIYFLLGLGIATAHSDYGVSFRAQNFDKTVQNIDKEAYIKHQREKRFVTGYFVPQNLTNKPTWGNLNITRNRVDNEQKLNNGNVTWPVYPTYNNINVRPGYNYSGNNTSNVSGYTVPGNSVTPGNTPYPGYPGYPAPNTGYQVPNAGYPVPNTGYPAANTGYPSPNTGYPAQNTVYPAPNTGYAAQNTTSGQNYNTTVTRPVYPNYNNMIIRPVNKNNFNNSNPSGYSVQPVIPVTPGNTPYYPVPNTGYPASNSGNVAPNTWYPASNTVYPAPNSGYGAPNTGYPAPNNGYPASSGYPVPNTFYPPPSSVIPPANVTGFVPKPNPGFTIHDAVARNNTNGFDNNRNGFNNTASLANCKCKFPRANSTITKEERTMDACMIACNTCPAGMKMSAFGICVEDLDYDE